GNFSVPITIPVGRAGFQPDLTLVYSTGNGNGLYGLGWTINIPVIARKTSDGIPRYRDDDVDPANRDTFVLSGVEDLVPIADGTLNPATATRYRPRTEGLFALVVHHHDRDRSEVYWEMRSKDGLTSLYGMQPPTPTPLGWVDPSVTLRPSTDGSTPRVFTWRLTATIDPFGTRIDYRYDGQDRSPPADERLERSLNQPLLTEVRYADYVVNNTTRYLVSVRFGYEDRPDAHSSFRAGFEIRTSKRCRAITVRTNADQLRDVRRYEFTYSNSSLNRLSLLTAI